MRRRISKEGTLLGNCLSSCNGSIGRKMPFTQEDVFSYKRKLVANLVSIGVNYIFLSLSDEEVKLISVEIPSFYSLRPSKYLYIYNMILFIGYCFLDFLEKKITKQPVNRNQRQVI